MSRIAVVGANGRLGAELCLRLRAAGHDVVAIARNPGGSAFLRLQGIGCRHGSVTERDTAEALLAGCEVVVHLAYAVPRTREAHRANLDMARNVVECAPAGAAVVLASTIMVYAPTLAVRLPDAYGLEKLQIERLVRRAAERRGSRAYVFRIGHTLGPLQPLTHQIEGDVGAGRLALPDGGKRASNTVFVATLAEAVAAVAARAAEPATYDLVTSPQWTWRDVYRFYGAEPEPAIAQGPARRTVRAAAGLALRLATRQRIRERLLVGAQVVPGAVAERAYGLYLRAAARRSLAAEKGGAPENGGVHWRGLELRHPVPGLSDPAAAELGYPLPPGALDPASWPDQIDS